MIDKPKGGRGKIAPYQTTTVRIPLPLKPDIDRLVEDYRLSVLSPILGAIAKNEDKPIPLEDALIKAQEILGDKKANKKVTVRKLLEAIYGEKLKPDSIP
jgi:hypothetical protein